MITKRKIISIIADFSHRGGGEYMLVIVHRFFKKGNYECIISSLDKYSNDLNKYFGISKSEYVKLSFKNISFLKNSIIISQHRKITTLLILLKLLIRFKYRIIHISNSEYNTLKYFTLFPSEIIAVSNKVKFNCINYFNIKENQIKVIYNGIEDKFEGYKERLNNPIKILYIARIYAIKNQLKIVNELKGKLINVKIIFVGIGSDYDELFQLTKNLKEFETLGFQLDLSKLVKDIDYFMLFSSQEGLPTCLIESCMYGRPFITNEIGGSLEILDPNENGFLINNVDELLTVINNLNNIKSEEYYRMCKNARKTYEDKFTLEKMREEYLKIIIE